MRYGAPLRARALLFAHCGTPPARPQSEPSLRFVVRTTGALPLTARAFWPANGSATQLAALQVPPPPLLLQGAAAVAVAPAPWDGWLRLQMAFGFRVNNASSLTLVLPFSSRLFPASVVVRARECVRLCLGVRPGYGCALVSLQVDTLRNRTQAIAAAALLVDASNFTLFVPVSFAPTAFRSRGSYNYSAASGATDASTLCARFHVEVPGDLLVGGSFVPYAGIAADDEITWCVRACVHTHNMHAYTDTSIYTHEHW